jgi:uncharacterized protein (DUF433 family)
MKPNNIEIVDRGRGPQLSTCRITVLDLMPYFQEGYSYEEIMRWIPTLSHDEIAAIERYYRDHKEACDEMDRRATERREAELRVHRSKFPELNETKAQTIARLRGLMEKRRGERNGERHPG